jgi:quinol monooxygenase YgiN
LDFSSHSFSSGFTQLTPRTFLRQPAKVQRVLELCPNLAYLSVMFIVHVHVQVKPEWIEAFKTATLANAQASVLETGVVRFDVVQQTDEPACFVLVEVYRDTAAAAAHKDTTHYQIWRDNVAPMMATPRTSVKFRNLFPSDLNW